MKKSWLIPFLFFTMASASGQEDTLKHRIVLVGDAGELHGSSHPTVDWIKKNIDWNDERNVLLYLGDNIYPVGLPPQGEPSYEYSKAILDYQISVVKDKKAKAYFVPGNHDWKNGKIGGWEQVKNQARYIQSLELKNVEFFPTEGCPGPIELELSDSVVLVFMDSHWWLHVHDKPGLESYCDQKTEDEVISVLEEISNTHKNHLLILAMHHPLFSYGVHGGNYTLRHHLFPFTEIIPQLYIPLPILGSVYPIARGVFGNIQDVKHPSYRTMIREVENVLKDHPNAIHVSGHDHALQMLMKDSIPYIVSGSGANVSRVKSGKWTEYATANYGFATIEVFKSGKVLTKFYTINSQDLSTPEFAKELKPIVQPESQAATFTRVLSLPDSVKVAGNPTLKGNWFRNFLMGANYRKEWTEPIKVRVLDIKTESGGLTPIKRGGGKQTKSLRLVDSTGKEYALRSIKKFPAPAMPVEFRETFVRDLVEDGISASYPYANLSMGPLTSAAGVPYLRARLVYVADDTLLGRFREDFANTLCMLEEREPLYVSQTYNTEELAIRLMKDNDDHVNQRGVLMSRILDMYIMDFDRHEDQWRWFTTDTGKGKIYNPIPRDRDQAFFVNEGFIPRLVRKRHLIPDIQGFEPKAYNIKTFNKSARNFDRAFMNELDEYQWARMTDSFLTKMTDDVLKASLALQPPEIRNYHSDEIIQKLQERKKYLKEDVLKYYRFISKIVNVTGSNQKELYTITRNADGTVKVLVNKLEKDDTVSSKIYERVFKPDITKEIRVYGMGGNDKFRLEGTGNSIRVRIIGGPGEDEFNSTGNSNKTIVYDAMFEKNILTGNTNYRNKISSDHTVNDYNRLYYKYNIFNPGIFASYNWDDGLMLGLNLFLTTHGFRKEPFKMQHSFFFRHALATKSYNFKYNAIFTKAIRTSDLVFNADVRAPIAVKNFFGLGNATVFDKSKGRRAEYYRARYNTADVSLVVRKTLQSWMNINYGISYQYFSLDTGVNRGKFITDFGNNGLNGDILQGSRSWAGPMLSLDIDNRNNKVLPTRGAKANVGGRALFGLGNRTRTMAQVNFDLSIFISIVEDAKLVLGTRFGMNHNFGKYEFFQAQYLGGNENLRGYHNYRFAGRTRYFNNLDLRITVAQFRTYFFPGSVGLVFFHDVGHVLQKDRPRGKWHTGYGGGVWLAPLKKFVIVASYMRSRESSLPLVTIGFQF